MSPRRRVLVLIGGAVGVVLLLALLVPPLVDLDPQRPRFERAASEALGMEVRVGGRLRMGLLPGPRLTGEEVSILDERGTSIASVKRIRLGIAVLPLFLGRVRLDGVELSQPVLSIERDTAGRLNVERLRRAVALLGALDGARVSLTDGAVHFADRRSGMRLDATGLDVSVRRLRLTRGRSASLARALSVRARLTCDSVRTDAVSVSDLEATLEGQDGVFSIAPAELRIFGGTLAGSLRVDVSRAVPELRGQCTLPRFRIEEFLAALSPRKAATGAMDFSANLAMRGSTPLQLVQTLSGELSLRGRDLVLEGNDLDRGISRYDSSQRFNLVDVGAVFFAGPMGLAVTKGYGFASLFRGSGGTSRIRALVSDWTVEHGVAHATDVALATSEHRIALRGDLDFVQERFADVTVAVIDAQGCARVRQAIHGPFSAPVVDKPRVLTSLAGPVVRLYRQTRGLFPAGPCESFYSGSVAAPE